MKVFKNIPEFNRWRNTLSGTVGFAPTMGSLHQGHLSLVERSTTICRHTVVSIYVNPTQFSPGEDFDRYPRDIDSDLEKLSRLRVDAVFFPDDRQMYPEGYSTFVVEQDVGKELEGKSRPGHFRGVTTIVAKLFNIVQPTHAFFGEKDAQQFRVIRKMTEDLNFPTEIVPCTTVREPHGLAMSSRNDYLSQDERKRAGVIYRALMEGKKRLSEGERSADAVRDHIRKIIETDPLARLEYVSVADDRSLQEIQGQIQGDILVSVAVFFARVRLIDNFTFHLKS